MKFWHLQALLTAIILACCVRLGRCEDYTVNDYFAYCDKHLFEKTVLHGGGSAYFGLVAETFVHDPPLAIAIGTAPGFLFEVGQHFNGESLLSNVLDVMVWDAPGAVIGVLASDIMWPKKDSPRLSFDGQSLLVTMKF